MFLKISTIIVSLFLLSLVTIRQAGSEKDFALLTINETKLVVEIADSESERYRGLSNRESLCNQCGMLFVFEDSQARTFVMREMNFALDMIWLNDTKVVGFVEKVKPEAGPNYTAHKSIVAADRVLEVPAGFVERNNISIGDSFSYATNFRK